MYRICTIWGKQNAFVSGKFQFDAQFVSDYPAVGDYVMVKRADPDTAIIHQVLPRKSLFVRKAAGTSKAEQVVAANIDTVFLCMSLNNDFSLRRLERYLAVAWESEMCIRDSGTPALTLTIDGPDVVCAQQEYEFTVTPPDGVTLEESFGYDTGMKGGSADLEIDDDRVGHGVVPVEWYDLQTKRFTLTAHGKTAGSTPVTGTKTVEVSPEHLYVDGVCGCGAVQTYTVEYIGGGDDPICADFKTHGEDLPLRGETFTMDGFVQTGWVDGQGAVYELGGVYTEDRDVTLYPVFERLITVTAPFTTTVALGDAGEPGETTFELALIDSCGEALTADNVTATAAVTTDGAGDYTCLLYTSRCV